MSKNRKKEAAVPQEDVKIKDFLDMIAPGIIKFNTDHFLCGNTYRCVWVLREYPTATDEQAILRHLGEKDGVTLRIYTRQVTAAEEKKIIHNAANKNRMDKSSTNDLQQTVTAESNLQDVVTLISSMHRNREPLLHCAVFIELTAHDSDALKLLQTDVLTELVRSKLNVDRLMLRQREGFLSVGPAGRNVFGSQFERVLPASSVANLYPFNYSGKTDPHGFYLGRDKFGSNIIADFDKRDDDKTNANVLILGNSGQGKSYLLKLILCNILESGKAVLCLDPEHEYVELAENLGGCFIDLMSGRYMINPLEPKTWDEGGSPEDIDAPQAFHESTKLSQHISFLKDFFRCYKDFSDRHIDTIEIMLGRLYEKHGISDNTDFRSLTATDYPILSDLYAFIEVEYKAYEAGQFQLYTPELLQEILLGLHSMCMGAESKFFNGHTNVTSDRFIVFGVKGLLQASKNVKNALLFNVLSFMSDKLLTEGNTVAGIDELYLFLTNLTAIEYIRNFMKRVRKKDSAVILASQNLEDFNIEGIRELTKPLFSIPTHAFLFNAGNIDKQFYIDSLQLEESEYNLIRFPQRGVCLYKCGIERYNLAVHAPAYKEMARIILKCPYLKGGEKTAAHLSNLVKYIATRDGVEKIKSGRELWHSTKKQKELITQILKEFPDTKDLFEYEDYCENPNRENASEFITIALEQHLNKIGDREKYLDYIANRPRVEKFDSHGLFTAGDEPLILNQVADEISAYTGNVWTPIISLRREDAARFGYDNALAWKALLSSKAMELAENLKIHPDHLKWYAAFHNESHHPHVHMVCYSTDPKEGYLTRQGIRDMKLSLANEIFRQELIPLYAEKSQRREDLKEQAAQSMGELIRQMKRGTLVSDRMEQLMTHLAERLQNTSGKKQYGYLKAELKNVVDEIVDELGKDSRIAEAYRLWWETRGRIESIYTETSFEPPPLSRCDDFKTIRNMVIQEALHIGDGIMTFEEPAFVETALPEDTTADDKLTAAIKAII